MNSQDSLLDALMHWSIKISGANFSEPWEQSSFFQAMSLVLCNIDEEYFCKLLQSQPTVKDLVGYSSEFCQSQLSLELPPSLDSLDDKFITGDTLIALFQMVYGIAFKVDKQRFLRHVLELGVEDREILMPFIEVLIKREGPPVEEQFEAQPEYAEPQPTARHMELNKLLQELEIKEAECKMFKDRIDELEQRNRDLEYNFQTLKEDNARVNEELSHTRSEKHELMAELGIRSSQAGYGEIVVRYREMLSTYQSKIDDLEQVLQRANYQIDEKNMELDQLRKTYGSLNTLPSDHNISSEQFEKLELSYQSKLEDCQRTIENLTATLTDRNEYIRQLLEKKEKLQSQNSILKGNAAKTEQSLERYRQLKRLTKGFFRQVQSQFKV